MSIGLRQPSSSSATPRTKKPRSRYICLKTHEQGNFDSARGTPRRPKVHQHHLAAQLGQPFQFAGESFSAKSGAIFRFLGFRNTVLGIGPDVPTFRNWRTQLVSLERCPAPRRCEEDQLPSNYHRLIANLALQLVDVRFGSFGLFLPAPGRSRSPDRAETGNTLFR
jgi:hypothetical protein